MAADDPKQLPTGVAELLAQSGYAAIPLRDLADSKRFADQIEWLEQSVKEAIRSQFSVVVEVVTGMRDEQDKHRAALDVKIAHYDKQHAEHVGRLDGNDAEHIEIKREITGVHRRLLLVEKTITKRPTRRKKPQRKKKP